ncbi:DHHC palmitoyltransferase-domain-containing protein [Bisporella sp. PMI_857]|nr:DHHC palmitoyltransferase-domain-containing protein [Bisporella sp. PMI_857]
MTRFSLSIPSIEAFAIPGVSFLISFLAYTSQILFHYIEPGPLSRKEAIWFNLSVLAIWWCYYLACTTDPGPQGWFDEALAKSNSEKEDQKTAVRWCKKCNAAKPPRAHHCRQCQRCIPKMDHHCPWTTNCVSHTTFPHFLRFVFYAVLSMAILEYRLYQRAYYIWENRNLPAYLGPPIWGMAHLFALILVNSITLFALVVLFTTAARSLVINTTMIETWEIGKHEAQVDRARKLGGYMYVNGKRVRVEHQEFPYDIGIWKNMCQGMGTKNIVAWLLPFGAAPDIGSAAYYEVNGFEDITKVWPPVDPEKVPRVTRIFDDAGIREYDTPAEEIAAFKRRQEEDFKRRGWTHDDDDAELESSGEESSGEGWDPDERWKNADGDTLADFGVDIDAESMDEDDIPLGELLRRRKNKYV